MTDFAHLTSRLLVTLLASALCACVVVPEKVASYDQKCMVATQKIELTVEQVAAFHDWDLHCTHFDCKSELVGLIASSALVTTSSAVVSGSIALVGNTLYWMENQGKCLNPNRQREQPQNTHPEKANEEYLLIEEIITAKS
ncbi:MAG: hypothetical protein K0Q78_1136 [Cellvibrio sp.]|jgi:hypothetical protein|nr:hypothetical protein [Cellvibrio sp.]